MRAFAEQLGVAQQIEFLGFREDRLSLLSGFDAFVLPSRLEGIPRCLMEAMAARVPVVTSDIPGSRDLVVDWETGLLFPVDDAASLANCLRYLQQDQSICERLSQSARERIRNHYSAERMARDYEALFYELVGRAIE